MKVFSELQGDSQERSPVGVGHSEQQTHSTSRKEMGSKQGLRRLLGCLQRGGCDSDMGEGEGLA